MKQSSGSLGIAAIAAALFAMAVTPRIVDAQGTNVEAFPAPEPGAPAGAREGGDPEIASVPATLAFQGLLTDSLGTPIDATVSLALAIYDVASGGAALWSETQSSVVATGGVFSVALGSVTAFPANLFAVTPRYLGIRVNGGAELAPRTPLRSSPYALQAGNADLLGGEAATAFLRAAGDTATGVLELQGGVRSLQLGAATEVVNSTTGVLARRYFFDDDGVSWSGVKATLVLSFNGSGTPGSGGAGSAVVAYAGATVDSIAVPAGGGRPWTYRVPLTLADNGTLDVTLRANSAGSPLYVRSITLETGESAAAPQWSESAGDLYRLNGNVGIGTAAPAAKLHVEGTARLGSAAADGLLEVLMTSSPTPAVQLGNLSDMGGELRLNDEAGIATMLVQPDASSGGGGFVRVARDSLGNSGLLFDGNLSGTMDPRLIILGASRSATFDMNQAGNGSVLLPADAISASEVLDEPGIASNASGSGVELTGSAASVLSATLTPPADGYVVAIGSCHLAMIHVNGTESSAFGALHTGATGIVPLRGELGRISPTAPSGNYDLPWTNLWVFPATGGTPLTIHLNFMELLGNVWVAQPRMVLQYFPTSYGTVVTAAAGERESRDGDTGLPASRGALTASEIEAERAGAIAANSARVAAELDEVRARLAELEREMKDVQRPR